MRPRDLPEAHRAITRAAQEHVQWRRQARLSGVPAVVVAAVVESMLRCTA